MPVGAGQQKYGMIHRWCPPATHTGAFSQYKLFSSPMFTRVNNNLSQA
jgi:hypothetical protein